MGIELGTTCLWSPSGGSCVQWPLRAVVVIVAHDVDELGNRAIAPHLAPNRSTAHGSLSRTVDFSSTQHYDIALHSARFPEVFVTVIGVTEMARQVVYERSKPSKHL